MDDKTALKVSDQLGEVRRLVVEAKSKIDARTHPEAWGPLDHAQAILEGMSVAFMGARSRAESGL